MDLDSRLKMSTEVILGRVKTILIEIPLKSSKNDKNYPIKDNIQDKWQKNTGQRTKTILLEGIL